MVQLESDIGSLTLGNMWRLPTELMGLLTHYKPKPRKVNHRDALLTSSDRDPFPFPDGDDSLFPDRRDSIPLPWLEKFIHTERRFVTYDSLFISHAIASYIPLQSLRSLTEAEKAAIPVPSIGQPDGPLPHDPDDGIFSDNHNRVSAADLLLHRLPEVRRNTQGPPYAFLATLLKTLNAKMLEGEQKGGAAFEGLKEMVFADLLDAWHGFEASYSPLSMGIHAADIQFGRLVLLLAPTIARLSTREKNPELARLNHFCFLQSGLMASGLAEFQWSYPAAKPLFGWFMRNKLKTTLGAAFSSAVGLTIYYLMRHFFPPLPASDGAKQRENDSKEQDPQNPLKTGGLPVESGQGVAPKTAGARSVK